MKFGLLWFSVLVTPVFIVFFPVSPPFSRILLIPRSISLSISPSRSVFFQSPCVRRNDRYSWTDRKFWKHHFLPLSGKSPLIVCNSSSPKIFYKSTSTITLSIVSITSHIYFISILYSYFVSRPLLFIYFLSISSLFLSYILRSLFLRLFLIFSFFLHSPILFTFISYSLTYSASQS